MINEFKDLITQYSKWLKDQTVLRLLENDWVEITTPYLDRHNDCICIYGKQSPQGFVITDGGYTIDDLEMCGCSLDSPKREFLLKAILNGFGINLDKASHRLEIHANKDNFAIRKHNLVQAILAINDLFYTAKAMVTSLFVEDVTLWLDSNDIRYSPGVKFAGKAGYDHLFDFLIPKSKRQPERILKALNNPNKDSAENMAFAWLDTKDNRPTNSRAYALLNDSNKEISARVIDIFSHYEVTPIPWSLRQNFKEELYG